MNRGNGEWYVLFCMYFFCVVGFVYNEEICIDGTDK